MDPQLVQGEGVVCAGVILKKGPGGHGQVGPSAPQIDQVSELAAWTLELGQQTLMEQLLGTSTGGSAGETKRKKTQSLLLGSLIPSLIFQ